MTSDNQYEQIAQLVSQIRNARFGEMVAHNEALLRSRAWRKFTTPVGQTFEFRRCEYDYFLAAQELDALTLRYAYLHAPATSEQLMRLADVTGRGEAPKNGDRRPRAVVAELYASDPSGAGKRIEAAKPVVTKRTARIAQEPQRRAKFHVNPRREDPASHSWRVHWTGEAPVAEKIAEKLLEDPR